MEGRTYLADEIELLTGLGFSKEPFLHDALVKWAFCLNSINKFTEEQNLKILDLGSGIGPLKQLLSQKHLVTAVDNMIDDSWFVLPDSVVQSEMEERIENVKLDALKFLRGSKELQFDVIIDCCSIIHFYDRRSIFRFLKSFHRRKRNNIASQIVRVLKPNGIFVYVTDISKKATLLEMNNENFYKSPFRSQLYPLASFMPEFFVEQEQKLFGVSSPRFFPTTTDVQVEIGVMGGILKKNSRNEKIQHFPKFSRNLELLLNVMLKIGSKS